jgi:hypothetical protein
VCGVSLSVERLGRQPVTGAGIASYNRRYVRAFGWQHDSGSAHSAAYTAALCPVGVAALLDAASRLLC